MRYYIRLRQQTWPDGAGDASARPLSIRDPDDAVDRLRTAEHLKHEMGDIGPGDEHPRTDILLVRRSIVPCQAPIEQTGRAHNGPVQDTVAKEILHKRQVLVVPAERGLGQRSRQMPHEEPVAGVVPRRVRPPG